MKNKKTEAQLKLSNKDKDNVKEIELRIDDIIKMAEKRIKDVPPIKTESYSIPLDDEEDDDDTYTSQSLDATFVELALINSYLYDCFKKKQKDVIVTSYGTTDSIGRLYLNGSFDNTNSFWFECVLPESDNKFFFQTKIFVDNRNELQVQLHITIQNGVSGDKLVDMIDDIKHLAFNNSEYKGKCIKVKLRDGRFRGIEIINIEESANELILNEVQMKFIEHFISRVSRGGNARYLLNGEPGTGKTESIREIARRLIPNVTFVIPEFYSTNDLTMIMEGCEIFDNAVIIMDDIDLFLGSRDNGSYTSLLGQFLSFFDGVKKRKISLLASTNDKGLVDKAAERPGRFNFTLDYSFLSEEQIIKVCNIHLPERWRVKEVYDALSENINGKKPNITGAFIANLADNIKEMSEDDEEWTLEDTVSLIKESYKGFYSSQVEKEKSTMGFIK